MTKSLKKLPAIFFRLKSGKEPVREWLKDDLSLADQKLIGHDIRDCEFSWPIGMPLCKSISNYSGLWEVRSKLERGNIARVFFCVHESKMVLLHAIKKKTQKTPDRDLKLAAKRQKELDNG